MTPTPPWTLVYADGSANVFRFQADRVGVRFTYEPIRPEQSSTGTYSGGAPIEQLLAGDDPRLAAVWEQALALEADTEHHADERNKGDGAFTLTTGEQRRRFLVVRAATRTFEAYLRHELRGLDE